MSTIVGDIIAETKSIVDASLGDWTLLRHVFDISKNDSRTADKAYGVRPLSADPSESVTKVYTVDQGFEIILSRTIARTGDDKDREAVLVELYDEADKIFRAMVHTRINLAGNVLLVAGPSLSEPEFFDENKLVILRVGVTVKYRNVIN